MSSALAYILSGRTAQLTEFDPDEDDVQTLACMLNRHGLLDAPGNMEASLRPAGSCSAKTWPGGELLPVEQLPPVHRDLHKHSTTSDASFVVAISTPAVQAVCKLQHGIRPLAQGGVFFYGSTIRCDSAHEVTLQLEEKQAVTVVLIRDMCGKGVAFVKAKSVGAAFTLAWYLNKTCKRQLLVGSQPVIEVEDAIWAHAANQIQADDFAAGVEWPAVVASRSPVRELKERRPCTEEESLRLALAKAHREMSSRGYDELIWNHMSARLHDRFLVTPGDRLWDRIEPQDLLLESKNCTAMVLHSAVYSAMPANAVIHTHAPCLEAVSCIQGGLKVPADSLFSGRVAYHDWLGVSDDYAECEEIVANINKVQNCVALICRNHGAFTWGSSLEEALRRHSALEAACREQLEATNL